MLTLYVLVNGSLKMSKGKASSQVAHAIAKLASAEGKLNKLAEMGQDDPSRVVVLEAKDAEQMRNLGDYAKSKGFSVGMYIDEGNFETDPFSLTAMAIQPFNRAQFGREEEMAEVLEPFPLFGKKQRRWFR